MWMSLTNPNLVYTIINEKITGRRVNPASAALFLDEYFKKKDKTSIIQAAQSKRPKKDSRYQGSIRNNSMLVVLIDDITVVFSASNLVVFANMAD